MLSNVIITFNAIVHSVREPEAKNNLSVQKILLQQPIYESGSGKFLKHSIFPVSILNENIVEFDAYSRLGTIMQVTCSLSSYKVEKEGEVYYNLSLLCIKFEESLYIEENQV